MEPMIRTLDQVDASSLALVGGKGANLGELVAAGVPVPAAFCVTTAAYRRFLDDNQLPRADRRAPRAPSTTTTRPASRRAQPPSARCSTARRSRPTSSAEIVAAYAALEARAGDGVAVSVRSSATAEDLPGTSFAGQQDTYLHIAGRGGRGRRGAGAAGRRCGPAGPSPTATRQGFAHESVLPGRRRAGDVPVRGRPACCSPPTR